MLREAIYKWSNTIEYSLQISGREQIKA